MLMAPHNKIGDYDESILISEICPSSATAGKQIKVNYTFHSCVISYT